jgi:hypothetical protein
MIGGEILMPTIHTPKRAISISAAIALAQADA